MDLVPVVLGIIQEAVAVAKKVKANKKQCQRLADRLRALEAPLTELQGAPRRSTTSAELDALVETLSAVNEARSEEHTSELQSRQ